ncbi:uncharacterized protein LOC125277522 [Megalobrama amblycephala]|uniref:uncharacterized protein LOC125277522 n=1 Tax=Megalobrama amblycephala TaxID=75352 RepID=UPI002013FBED|nr:uncharacterized protein LOC125277522 [Megalobrama amblycephala]
MFVLGLLTCIVLRAFSAQAKVVRTFDECKQFFYKETAPRGMDQNTKIICQMYEQGGSYYATLYYSDHHRIPLYSAYTFDSSCSSATGRTDDWHIEPQISQPRSQIDHMVLEKDSNKDIIKRNQAISKDYTDTGYDRGHLNPNSFQCNEGRLATFTLTNAAPMDACFNRVHWKNWETTLRSFLKPMLVNHDATAYIVTGTVPDANLRIPQRGISEEPERVTVPSHIWTAVCYKHPDDRKSFSFGYMGKNQPEGDISLMTISNLNNRLGELYSEQSKTYRLIKIFDGDCFGDSNKLIMVQNAFQKLINLAVYRGVQMSSGIQTMYRAVKRTVSSDSIPEKKVKVSEMTVKLAFDSMSTYYTVVEDLKAFAGSACLITHAKPLLRKIVHDELRKREVSEGRDAVECLLVPEKQKTAADGSPCTSVTEFIYSCQCKSGSQTKPCCSSPCLYQDNLNSYRCYSGQTQIECSPRYSVVTAYGERCLDDHPCGTYGKDYYWCWTNYDLLYGFKWDYCSPPLWRSKAKNGKYCRSNHACAYYGSDYRWCYTDDKNNYDQCCISDDCFSTVTDKTCRSDHSCGYHGETYLWCYTDYKNNYDYCCKNCN